MTNQNEFAQGVLKSYKELSEATSTTIKINHSQVIHIVVNDLVKKYKYNARFGDAEWATTFRKVLSYYLTADEIDHYLAESEVE